MRELLIHTCQRDGMAKLPSSLLKYTARGRLGERWFSWTAISRQSSTFTWQFSDPVGRLYDRQICLESAPPSGHRPLPDCPGKSPIKHDAILSTREPGDEKRHSDYHDGKCSGFSVLKLAYGMAWGTLSVASAYYLWNHCRSQPSLLTGLESQSVLKSVLFPQVVRAHCLQGGGDSDGKGPGNSNNGDPPSKRFNFLAEAVEIASPSVVFIERKQQVSSFFGDAMSVSSGSGFVVGDGTFVLTNAHVVGNSKVVQVELKSGRKLKGEVTETDQVADLALIKVNLPSNEKLPALKFGSSSDLRPGEWVVALGSPLSLSNTTTAGIVSSVLRPSKELGIQRQRPDMEYVQTDAPITIGNSGGPLVNLDGEVIGVNTMTAGPGISFAIPSDFAKAFVENATKTARKQRKLSRYVIGVSMLSITPGLLIHLRHRVSLPSNITHGVFLAEVWPSGAAAEAGLRSGDVILRIDGKDIYTNSDMFEKVQTGKRLVMEVARGRRLLSIIVQPEPID